MVWTSAEAAHLLLWYVFVPWQQSVASNVETRRRYESVRKRVQSFPPGWLFGIAWFVLYKLITAAAFLYFEYESTPLYVATFVLFSVNIVLNKAWSVAFWDQQAPGVAMLVIVATLLTAIAVVVLMGLSEAWLPFALYLPYVVWLAYATILNAQWLS